MYMHAGKCTHTRSARTGILAVWFSALRYTAEGKIYVLKWERKSLCTVSVTQEMQCEVDHSSDFKTAGCCQ